MSGQFLLLSCFGEISELNANSVDPEPTPLYAASDLGFHCLSATLILNARLNWVKHVIRKEDLRVHCRQLRHRLSY